MRLLQFSLVSTATRCSSAVEQRIGRPPELVIKCMQVAAREQRCSLHAFDDKLMSADFEAFSVALRSCGVDVPLLLSW